jgi:hypothetical protein
LEPTFGISQHIKIIQIYMSIFENVSNYYYWIKNSVNYSIIHTLEFCGSDKFIFEVALSLPQFDLVRPDFSDAAATSEAFVKYFNTLPEAYKAAITKNSNLDTAFYSPLLDKLDWKLFVENRGVDIKLFISNMNKMDIYVCANSNIRKDVFDLFDFELVQSKLNLVQKLRSPHFSAEQLQSLYMQCRSEVEKNTFVDRIILNKYKPLQPVWTPTSIFWYNYFTYNRSLCSVFCDERDFLLANEKKLDWDKACMNPSVDMQMIERNIINKTNIMKSRSLFSFIRFFNDSDPKPAIFDWYVHTLKEKSQNPYLGNLAIFSPLVSYGKVEKIKPEVKHEFFASVSSDEDDDA